MFGFDVEKRKKLKGLELEIIEIQGQKREMEIELKNQQLDLGNAKREQEARLAEIRHEHNLKLKEKEALFSRIEKEWKEDKTRLEAQFVEDKERAIEHIKQDSEREQLELKTLMKLESEQKIAKAILDAEKKIILKDAEISDLKKVHAEQLAQLKSDLAKEHYDNLQANLEKFHTEGNTTTKFMKELSMEMLKSRRHDMSVGVDVSTPALGARDAE